MACNIMLVKKHPLKAKLERNYYENSRATKKLVDEHFMTKGKADYCSVDVTAHYSYKMFILS